MPDTLIAPPILSLDDALDTRLVGGKASGLSRLIRLGVPVPRGFVIPASTTALFDREAIPDDARCAIVEAWRSLAAPLVIVRSSAIGEDSADASFAGQLDSIPGVTDADGLRDAILRCWRSRGSARVRAYERARGHALGGIGIVVQQQIDSSISGVLFTKDPAGTDGALLEYCKGAGEDLVAGRINPGRAMVDTAGRVRHLADADAYAMSPEDIAALVVEGRRIAAAFGAPQDIEWTMDPSGHLWFVQARPITAVCVPPNNGGRRHGVRERQILWSNANVNENFPEPITPLLYSVALAGYYHYFLNLGRAFGLSARRLEAIDEPLRQIIGVHGARMYYNLTSIHTVLRAAPFGEQLAAAFNQFVGADELAKEEPGRIGWRDWRAVQALELLRIAVSVAWQFLFLTRRVETFERTVDEYARRTEPSQLHGLARPALRDRLRGFMEIRRHRWKNASLADAGSMVCYAALKAFLGRIVPGESQDALHNNLLKALPGLASSRPAIELWKLSRAIRADARLAALFAAADHAEYADNKTAADHAEYADNKTTADHAEYADSKTAADHPEYADSKTAADHAEYADNKTAADHAEYADNKTAADHAEYADNKTAADPAEYADSKTTADHPEYADSKTAADHAECADNRTTADPDAVLAEVRTNPAFAEFSHAFDTYLDTWGFRCSAELMLTAPSFQENPAPLVSILKAYAECDGESPDDLLARQQAERVAETRRVLAMVGWIKAVPLRVLLGWTQRSIQLRERARLKQALLYSRLRRVALAIGDDLSAEGRLERRDDVFMLTFEELDTLLAGGAMFPDHLAREIRGRVRAHADLSAMRPPDKFVLPEGGYLEFSERRGVSSAFSGTRLTGTSACGGRATARATVLADVTESHKLHTGDILVTRQTDPGWGPVFPLIAGLVMERGGMLSHGAIIAREFGIPSIVGVANATRLIPSGARVCLDGDRGTVRLVEDRV